MSNTKVDWKKVKFIARPDTWFDENTTAIVISEADFDLHLKDGSCLFKGKKNGTQDEEYCLLTEFDWIYEGKCINDNIPDIHELGQAEDPYVYVDLITGIHYNVLQNEAVAQELVIDLDDSVDTKESAYQAELDAELDAEMDLIKDNYEAEDFDFASENPKDIEPTTNYKDTK